MEYVEDARKIVAAGTTARLDERDADLLCWYCFQDGRATIW